MCEILENIDFYNNEILFRCDLKKMEAILSHAELPVIFHKLSSKLPSEVDGMTWGETPLSEVLFGCLRSKGNGSKLPNTFRCPGNSEILGKNKPELNKDRFRIHEWNMVKSCATLSKDRLRWEFYMDIVLHSKFEPVSGFCQSTN